MSKILVTWELGGGSGHVVPLRPVIDGLLRRGHAVVAVVRDVPRAARAWTGCAEHLPILQAPFRIGAVRNPIRPPHTFAHVLHDVGYADGGELAALVGAWRTLIGYVKPDLMLCDHSPTALLAARGMAGVRRAVIGSGFICPPDQSPLPDLRFWDKADPDRLAGDEAVMLARMNDVLGRFDQPPIERVTQIYGDVDATFLTTFAELDHFPWRERGVRYRGAWTSVAGGVAPRWPDGERPRVFAYLKPCPALPAVLRWLAESGRSTVAHVEGVDAAAVAARVGTPANVRFEPEPVDMGRAAGECDLAVLHASHGATLAMLLAGRPVALLPVYLEQGLLAHAVCRTGAGAQGAAERPQDACAAVAKIVEAWTGDAPTSPYAAARRFASKYVDYDASVANERIVDEIGAVLSQNSGRAKTDDGRRRFSSRPIAAPIV